VIYEPFLLVESLGSAGVPRIWKTMAENVLNLQRTFANDFHCFKTDRPASRRTNKSLRG
jgi:hypothetical protein